MRVLLDTHALLWWLEDGPALSIPAREAIADPGNTVYVSAASAWEIATKYRIGKLAEGARLVGSFSARLAKERFSEMPISVEHGERAGSLPGEHRDPFDRMIVAQALAESLLLISNERAFDAFGVARLW